MIEGVEIKKLRIIPDKRGFLMEILRSDDPLFQKFGQVYLTSAKYGVAKAWHYHKFQDDYFVCLLGKILVVLYDQRKNSSTYREVNEFEMSDPKFKDSYLLKIPKGVVHGFTPLEPPEARLLNIPTELYNYQKPDEYRYPWNSSEVPYNWPDFVKKGG